MNFETQIIDAFTPIRGLQVPTNQVPLIIHILSQIKRARAMEMIYLIHQ